ncbi:hypothetical protein C7271_02640 [filamentous cyanobacterium CCP5]|nr:hypothetical protein C7271_02640 [filamentous cyanobacterium CCP5]
MLIHLASYPRCGHSWIRTLITKNWKVVPTHDGPVGDLEPYRAAYPEFNFRLSSESGFAIYTPGPGETRSMLLPGIPLTLALRKQLAESQELFLIKTHKLPENQYFVGERSIQIVRHPGAAIVSYHRLLREQKKEICLEQVIQGNASAGSWSAYHKAWMIAPIEKLILRYEDLHLNELKEATKIGRFLGFSAPPTIVNFLAQEKTRNAERYPDGTAHGWLKQMAKDEHKSLWKHHSVIAQRFGYGPKGILSSLPDSILWIKEE